MSTKLCPYCSEEIQTAAIKCKHCGSMLTDGPGGVLWDSDTVARQALSPKYKIQEEIGRGGMAVVYKATETKSDRTVALKVLPSQFTHDREFLDRFHREAREAARLNHPNIVTVYAEGSDNGVHYISMEWLDGIDLHALLKRRGHLDAPGTVEYLVPIAEALDHAHRQGVIHRDVKSANIIVEKSGRPVLMDFGIARASQGTKLTQTGTVIGTPEYMSPEQAQGNEIDGRSDLYSLGVVLYECLAGRVPFTGANPIATVHQVIYEKPTRLRQLSDGVPEELEAIVMRLLSKDKEGRFQTGRELAQALRRAGTRTGSRPLPREPEASRGSAKPTASSPARPIQSGQAETVRVGSPSPGLTASSSEKAMRRTQADKPTRSVAGRASERAKAGSGISKTLPVLAAAVVAVIVLVLLITRQAEQVASLRTPGPSSEVPGLSPTARPQVPQQSQSQKPAVASSATEAVAVSKEAPELQKKATIDQFSAEIEKATRAEEWDHAFTKIQQLQRLSPFDSKVPDLKKRLLGAIIKSADRQMNNGQYADAQGLYLKALQLEPNDMALKIKLAKAEEKL